MSKPQAETVLCEVWLMVTEDGSFDVSTDPADLKATGGESCRVVKVTVNVPKPKTVELEATIGDEAEPVLKVA